MRVPGGPQERPNPAWQCRRPDSIILMGGENGGTYRNDVWRSTDYGGNWTLIKPDDTTSWLPRGSHTSVRMPDDSIVLMGGENNNAGFMNDVWRSTDGGANMDTDDRRRRVDNQGIALKCGDSGGSPDKIILMGGEENGIHKNDVWESTDNGATWKETKPNDVIEWSARDAHTSVDMPDGSIVLMGGQDSRRI